MEVFKEPRPPLVKDNLLNGIQASDICLDQTNLTFLEVLRVYKKKAELVEW